MKNLEFKVALCLLPFAFCLISGCQQPKRGVKVFINEDGVFPPELAGRWVSENDDWIFEFDKNGVITSAMISLGRVHIIPGKTTTVPMQMDGTGTYVPGVWVVTYTPSKRELVVETELTYFRAELGPTWLEGSSRDLFVGIVSEDGTAWDVDWVTIPHYTAYVPEPHELPVDPEDAVKSMTFHKQP